MNKALHFLVYLFLVLSAASLWFEIELNKKRELLTDRNEMQEEYLIKIANTIEKAEPNKDATAETKKDISPIEAKFVDIPETENVLEDYNAYLEQDNLETFSWNNMQTKEQLRRVYVLDSNGDVVMDGVKPLKEGVGTEYELLNQLFDAAKKMQSKLNTTRAELTKLHKIINDQVDELNKLKPVARQDKVTIVEKDEKIKELEKANKDLEDKIVSIKTQIEELNAEKTSLIDERDTAQNNAAAAAEEVEKAKQREETLKSLLTKALANNPTGNTAGITSLPAGDKGTVIEADNTNMFAIVEFDAKTMKELKGDDLDHPIPNLELGVKRPGFHGEAGEFIGRIRLRQEVREKNYIICDILGPWKQDVIKPDDVVFAD